MNRIVKISNYLKGDDIGNNDEQHFQSKEINALDALAGGMAHDFNNILGAIAGNLSLLKRDFSDTNRRDKLIRNIEMAVKRATALTSRLLAFPRKRGGRSLCFDISSLIEEVMDLVEHSFDNEIKVISELEEELGYIEGDPNQLYHVLLNLCINARDAIVEREKRMGKETDCRNGIICIRTCRVDLDADMPEIHGGFKKAPLACITVADNGVGMDRSVMSRIFEPFFTTKQKGDGSGLGLAIAHGIIVSHKGFIKVDSNEGEGTEFKIYLPLKERSASIKFKASEQYEVVEGKGTILVVEDEWTMRDVQREMLIQIGYSTFCAGDGKEALDLFQEKYREIDLVILDLNLPEMDGVETFFEMKKIDSEVKVVAISGFTENEEIKRLRNAGLSGFIRKPFDMEKISRTIDGLLQSPSEREKGLSQ